MCSQAGGEAMLPKHQLNDPKKDCHRFYSGKKKRHTFKTQLVVDPVTKAVICTTFAAGQEHDFHRPLASTRGTRARQWTHLFKRSKVKIKQETKCWADKGYQGIQKVHFNSQLPKKKRIRQAIESAR